MSLCLRKVSDNSLQASAVVQVNKNNGEWTFEFDPEEEEKPNDRWPTDGAVTTTTDYTLKVKAPDGNTEKIITIKIKRTRIGGGPPGGGGT